jgi:hypothetical protein
MPVLRPPEMTLQSAVIGTQQVNHSNWGVWAFNFIVGEGLLGLPAYAHAYPHKITQVPALPYPYFPIAPGGTAIPGGHHQLFQMTTSPSCNIVGTEGSQPCVSVIIQYPGANGCPAGGVFHFYPADSVHPTITQYNWPQGSHAVIAGGNNEGGSAGVFTDAMGTLSKLNIPFKIVNSSGIFLAPNGKWYIAPSRPGYIEDGR